MRFVPVILAGGKGERFWPLSRKDRPKQFLRLDGSGRSLLQATADRLLPLAGGFEGLLVVTAASLAAGVREHLSGLPEANLLLEPEGRDTAPAVAWATLEAAKRFGEEVVLGFFPADHWVGDAEAFHQTIRAAAELAARQEAIVTLGIEPKYPATGYGYIERGEESGVYGGLSVYRVARFTEKPDREAAEAFLKTGRYYWNGGIFVFRAGVSLKELRQHAPEVVLPLLAHGVAAYAALPKTSIDYALMEKTERAYAVPAAFGWDDLGDWTALERLLKGERPGMGVGKHLGIDTVGSIFYTTSGDDLIVTIGLEDVVIVRDGLVTLVVRKDRIQEIKQVLEALRRDPSLEDLL